MRMYSLSLVCQLSSTDYVKTLAPLRDASDIIGHVVVLSVHCEVLESECQRSSLSSDGVKPLESSIPETNFCLFFVILTSKFFHSSGQVLCFHIMIFSQGYSFLFWADGFGWYNVLKASVVGRGKGVVVIIVILSQHQSGFIVIWFQFFRDDEAVRLGSTKKSLKG